MMLGLNIGTYTDEEMFKRLTTELAAIGCRVIRPTITNFIETGSSNRKAEATEIPSDSITEQTQVHSDNIQSPEWGSD